MKFRNILLLLTLLNIIQNYASRTNISLIIVRIVEEFPYAEWQTGLILGGFPTGYMITQGIGGMISDKYGCKCVLAFSTFGWTVAELLTLLTASNFPLLLLSRIFGGLVAGFAFPACQSFIGHWIPIQEQHLAVSLTMGVANLGLILTYAFGPLLISSLSWKWFVVISATIGFTWLVPWIILASSRPLTSQWLPLKEKVDLGLRTLADTEDLRAEGSPKKSILRILRVLLKTKAMWGIIIVQLMNSFSYKIFANYLPTYLYTVYGFSIEKSGFLSIWVYVLSMVFAILSTWLNSWNMSTYRKRVGFQLLGMFGSAILLLAAILIQSEAAIPCLFVSLSFYAFSGVGVQMSHIDLSAEYAGLIYGIGAAFSNLAGVIGTALTGVILEKYQNWNIVFGICIANYVLGGII